MLSSLFFCSTVVTLVFTVLFPVQGLYTDLHGKATRSLSNSSTSSLSLSNTTTIIEDSVENSDCDGEALAIVGQAINDAVTMAKAVQQVWSQRQYYPILQWYMGRYCLIDRKRKWIQSKRH